MAYKAGRQAHLYYSAANTSTLYAGAAITMDDLYNHQVYRIPTAEGDERFIDNTKAMTVKVDSVTKTKGVDYKATGPCIVFFTALAGTEAVTIEGHSYWTTTGVILGRSWELSLDFDTEDLMVMETDGDPDNGWKRRVPMMTTGTVTIDRWFQLGGEMLNNFTGKTIALTLFTEYDGGAGPRYECYGFISKDSIKDPAGGLVTENLTVDLDGMCFYMAD